MAGESTHLQVILQQSTLTTQHSNFAITGMREKPVDFLIMRHGHRHYLPQ